VQEYHDKYLSDIQFDNVYVTQYFRKIDARRHKAGHHTLLPLKKVERATLLDPYGSRPGSEERQKLVRVPRLFFVFHSVWPLNETKEIAFQGFISPTVKYKFLKCWPD